MGSQLTPMVSRNPKGISDLSNEILTNIATLLPPPGKLNLALSAPSALSEPVFRALWRSLPSPLPALSLIPGFCIDERTGDWTLQGPLNNADLDRFRYYSQFVRTCIFPSATAGMQAIERIFQVGGTLFPKLKICHFGGQYNRFTTHSALVLTFLSTCIETAAVHLPTVAVGFDHSFSRSLLSLTLSGAISPADFAPLKLCTLLQELVILPGDDFRSPSLGSAALEIASRMPSLKRLSLDITGRLHTPPRITSVTSLVLCGEPIDIRSALACFVGLQDITLKFKHRAGLQKAACEGCFSHIGRHYGSTLTRLEYGSDWNRLSESFPMSKSLKYLYDTIKDLKCLSISVAEYMWSTDIALISKCWPNLEEVTLNVSVAASSLLELARLPRLRIVSARFGNICRLQIPSITPFDKSFSPVANYTRGQFSDGAVIYPWPVPSQNRVQLNPDVLENIFGYLNSYELRPLLVVSRLVYVLARKFLWRILPSLVPLVRLLPGKLTINVITYHWVPSPADNNFNAFDCHAELIEGVTHEILCCPASYESIDESVFEMLQAIRPGHILLPRLKGLRYFRPDLPSAIYALPFISTHLKSLALDVKDDCTSGLLASVFSLSPNITDIRLSGLLRDSLLVSLRCFTKLSVLSLQFNQQYYTDNPPPQYAGHSPQIFFQALTAAFEALDGTSTLTTLGYNIPFSTPVVPIPKGRWCRTVTNLRVAAPPEAMQHQLPAFCSLITASLHFQPSTQTHSMTADLLEECCRYLTIHSGGSLRALSINCSEILLRPVFEHIRPLMGIHGMKAFSLRLKTSNRDSEHPYLRRSDAGQIAFHWPALEELIMTGPQNVIQVAPTFHDLLPLSRLTALRTLQIQGLPPTTDYLENLPNLGEPFNDVANIVFPIGQLQPQVSRNSNQLHDVLTANQSEPYLLGL